MSARSACRRRGLLARAFTLVEMLIAMVLTLIMVAAIAEFYARVGDTVKDGRAMIEVGSQLRNAVQRLKTDLDLLTMNVNIWSDDGQASGYFEINEGVASDSDANGNFIPDPAVLTQGAASILDNADDPAGTAGAGTPDWLEPLVTNLLGDGDDVLSFTARSGDSPWVGEGVDPTLLLQPSGAIYLNGVLVDMNLAPANSTNPPTTVAINAPYAEIVWWTGFTDSDKDGRWDLNEPRFIVRRQLLIRPDLNVVHPNDANAGAYFVKVPTSSDIGIYEMSQLFDISLRPVAVANNYTYYVANSLADLTKRENRYLHVMGAANFPNQLDLNVRYAGDPLNAPNRAAPINNQSQYRWLLAGDRRGEDVILSNVIAFDLRVYDPSVSLRPDVYGAAAVNLLTPGDPGYPDTLLAQLQNTNVNQAAGQGAYVDLGYGSALLQRLPAAQANQAVAYCANLNTGSYFGFQSRYFQQAGNQLSLWATYDTWSLSYERDGLNQDWRPATLMEPNNDGAGSINTGPFDEGSNGLDDDGNNGVDDNGERETLPPFPRPLRGIQVKLRVYEPGTRQMRQATVAADFITE